MILIKWFGNLESGSFASLSLWISLKHYPIPLTLSKTKTPYLKKKCILCPFLIILYEIVNCRSDQLRLVLLVQTGFFHVLILDMPRNDARNLMHASLNKFHKVSGRPPSHLSSEYYYCQKLKEPEWIQSYMSRACQISCVIYPDFGNIKLTSCDNLLKYLAFLAQSWSYAMACVN